MGAITGKVVDATGTAVQNVPVRLTAIGASAGAEETIGAMAVLQDRPVESLTAADGTWSITAIEGVLYQLEIEACKLSRIFRMPSGTVSFEQLGLVPVTEVVAYVDEESGDTTAQVTVRIGQQATVRERYNSVVVEWCATLTGTYTELDTLDLVPGVDAYEVEDPASTLGVFYRSYYLNTDTADQSQKSDAVAAAEARNDLLVSVDDLKQVYLFGASLQDDSGTPFPSRMFEWYIDAAVAQLEKELDVPLVATDITDEVHDHYGVDYSRWGWLKLHKFPVIQVDRLAFQYPSMTDEVVINDDWIVLEDNGQTGVVQVVPGQGSIADVLLIPGSLMPLWSGTTGRVPGIWHVDYRAGFEPGTVPGDVKHAIAMMAAVGILNIAGDLIAGAGIANLSISVPGLSQSVGTTSSATNSGYGSRIIEYQKELKELLPVLKSYFGKTMKLVVV